jgi:hypothetical protein
MPAALKKPETSARTAKRKPARKSIEVVSEVDVLIARLKKIRKGQAGTIDLRPAIEDGRR